MSANTSAPAVLDRPAIGRLEPLRPLPVHEVNRAMAEYQEGLHAILDATDWQKFEDRDGRERQFVKRPGWRKIGTWFGLDLLIGRFEVDRDDQGEPLRARVVGRAVAPNGRVAEDVGACSMTERGFSKPEHDLISTAATRALNRATSNLVGMGELSAEEVADEVEPLLPEWAQAAGDLATMTAKLAELMGEQRARALIRAIGERYGYVPNITAGFVNAIHSMLAPELAQHRNPQEPS